MPKTLIYVVSLFMTFALIAPFEVVPSGAAAQDQGSKKVFSQEELDQIVAPIALYPDSLLAQIFMASTYPLEVVQADRWAKQNKNLTGDALAAALEKQGWDPSVKSLVNFPQVLTMMSEKLDWTMLLGDAFLAQQKEVMDTVQKLRKKAESEGNLKTTKEQKVVVEQEAQTIVIESASPQVVYVPSYNPTVVYGAWPYPAYPPYYYYPPGYAPGAGLFYFGAGVAVGVAWGYAWGDCHWHGGEVDIDVDRNIDVNHNIDRTKYKEQYQGKGREGRAGQGSWQHNPEHRKGVAYRDQATGQKFNRASTTEAMRSREGFRGRAESGRQDLSRGGADQFKGSRDAGTLGGSGGRAGSRDLSTGRADRGGSAFSGMDRSGRATRDFSNRGSFSRQSMSSGSRGGGFGGGASRSGGFGGRGGRGGGRR